MNVEDLMADLSVGELSNLSMSGEGAGTILEDKQSKIINYINDGLLRLHSRFILIEKTIIIEMIEGMTNYYLLERFAQSNCDPENTSPRYIRDLLEPFEQDVIKILKVNDHVGRNVTLNDESNALSMFTPRPIMLQVPRPVGGYTLSVTYQARHRVLQKGVLEAPIYLPDVLEEPLRAYVASKVYSHMNGQDNSAKGQEYKDLFESLCQEVIDRDTVNSTPSTTSLIFNINGWI